MRKLPLATRNLEFSIALMPAFRRVETIQSPWNQPAERQLSHMKGFIASLLRLPSLDTYFAIPF